MNIDKICSVFVCNKLFLNSFKKSLNDLINNGLYNGDIVLIIGDDIDETEIKLESFIVENGVKVLKLKDITFSRETKYILESIKTDGRNIEKKFQWHKLHVFNIFFKQWDYVLYLDCGMKIHSDIKPILDLREKNKFIAQSDNYPDNGWNLSMQFDKNNNFFNTLNKNFNLSIDYPQTGLMLFDTNLITNDLFDDIIKIVNKYPITRTNEQSYVSLYFTNINKCWKKLPKDNGEKYYYHPFRLNSDKEYIITKYN